MTAHEREKIKQRVLTALSSQPQEDVEAWIEDVARQLNIDYQRGLLFAQELSREQSLFRYRIFSVSPKGLGLRTVDQMLEWGGVWESLCRLAIWHMRDPNAWFDELLWSDYPTTSWLEAIPSRTLFYLPDHVIRLLHHALDEGVDLRQRRYGAPSVGAALWAAINAELATKRAKGRPINFMDQLDDLFLRCVECGLELTELSVIDSFGAETDRLKACVEAGASLTAALAVALSKPNLEAIEWLVERGADPNDRLHDQPAFYYAKSEEALELADAVGADHSLSGSWAFLRTRESPQDGPLRALRAAFAPSQIVPRSGAEPKGDARTIADRQQRKEVTACLTDETRTDPRAVVACAAIGDRDMLERALAAGADPNARAWCGGEEWSAIAVAVAVDAVDVVRQLLAAGADLNPPAAYGLKPPWGRTLTFPPLALSRSVEMYQLLREVTDLDPTSRRCLLRLLAPFDTRVDKGPHQLLPLVLREAPVSKDEVAALEAMIELHTRRWVFPAAKMKLLHRSANGEPLALPKQKASKSSKPVATVYSSGSLWGVRIGTQDQCSELQGVHCVCDTRDITVSIDADNISVVPLSKGQASRIIDVLGQRYDSYHLPTGDPDPIEPAEFKRGKEAFIVAKATFPLGDDEVFVSTIDVMPIREWNGFAGAWKSSFQDGPGRIPFDELNDFDGSAIIESWDEIESRYMSKSVVDGATKKAIDMVVPQNALSLRQFLGRLQRH